MLRPHRSITPVSYTHLDVYKRQGWSWAEVAQELSPSRDAETVRMVVNQMCIRDRYRYALVESDGLDIETQTAIIHQLELPCAALVYSGKKSLHAIVRVDAPDYACLLYTSLPAGFQFCHNQFL